jgi:hypothetical protein
MSRGVRGNALVKVLWARPIGTHRTCFVDHPIGQVNALHTVVVPRLSQRMLDKIE